MVKVTKLNTMWENIILPEKRLEYIFYDVYFTLHYNENLDNIKTHCGEYPYANIYCHVAMNMHNTNDYKIFTHSGGQASYYMNFSLAASVVIRRIRTEKLKNLLQLI